MMCPNLNRQCSNFVPVTIGVLTTIKSRSEATFDDGVAMNWLSIETAPFDRDLELAVIDFDGAHPLVFAVVSSAVGSRPTQICP